MNKGIYRIAAGVGAAVILVSSATAQAATVTANGTPAPVASDSIAGWPAAPAVTSETAVLIDADNISPKYAPIIFQELEAYGFPSCRRIYGNWSKANGWNEELLLEYSIIPVQQFAYTSGKNATDMAMVIDAMDLLHAFVNATGVLDSPIPSTYFFSSLSRMASLVKSLSLVTRQNPSTLFW